MAQVATVLIVLGICGLLWLDRAKTRISIAIWVPFLWLLIASSRPVSSWLSAPSGSRAESYLEGSPLDRAILLLLTVLGVLALSRNRGRWKEVLRLNTPIIVFLLYCLMSVLWAEYPFVSFKRWIRTVADIVMVLVILTDSRSEDAIRWILSRISYVLVPLSILFVRFFPELGRAYSYGGAPMWTGVCTDKNALGALCMIFGVGLLWRILAVYSDDKQDNRGRRLLSMSTVFLMIQYLIWIIDSKTALMGFLLGSVLVLLTLDLRFRRPAVVVTMVIGIVATCYAVLFLGIGSGALETIGRESSLTGRTRVWEVVLMFAANPWIGAGYENFWIGDRLVPLTRFGGNQAHNGYLEIYLNLGWVGLALLAGVIVSGCRNLISGFHGSPDLSRLKLGFFVICLIYNFTEAAFKMNTPVWIMFLWATMATPDLKNGRSLSQYDYHLTNSKSQHRNTDWSVATVQHWTRASNAWSDSLFRLAGRMCQNA